MKNKLLRTSPTGVEIFIFTLILSFFIHSILRLFSVNINELIFNYVSFSPHGISLFLIWTPFSYTLIHDGIFHLIVNLLGIYFIGKAVENDVGKTQFIYLLLIGALCGCLFWFIFNSDGEYLVGASSIVMSCLSYFCLKNPNSPITLLLFFIIPCRLKPKVILICVLCIDIYGFIFNELNNTSGIAHSAHLGGLCGGAFFFLYLQSGRSFPHFVLKFSSIKKSNKIPQPSRFFSKGNYKINFSSTNELQQEVDRILDKINESGFGSLSEQEKLTLEKAKGLL